MTWQFTSAFSALPFPAASSDMTCPDMARGQFVEVRGERRVFRPGLFAFPRFVTLSKKAGSGRNRVGTVNPNCVYRFTVNPNAPAWST